jgi:hypothetical protein
MMHVVLEYKGRFSEQQRWQQQSRGLLHDTRRDESGGGAAAADLSAALSAHISQVGGGCVWCWYVIR